MKNKRTIHLHIGMPKTGTSSLQFFCRDNQSVLEQHGYCYPIMPVRYRLISQVRNAHFLIGYFSDEAGEVDSEKTLEERERAFSYIKGLFETYPNIILSDEGIWNSLSEKKKDALLDVKSFCDSIQADLKVIVYLRSQDDFLESYWKQKILRRGAVWSWKNVMCCPPDYIALDYYPRLCDIAGVVGQENLMVRRYERGAFLGGSIFSDFLGVVGLELTEEYIPLKEQKNISLSNNYAEIKRILNRLVSEEPRVRERELAWLERLVQESSDAEGKQYESSMFSEAERKKFMERYQESNARVARDFMGEKELFRQQASSFPKWKQDNPRQYEDTLLLLGKGLFGQRREIEELKRELRAVKQIASTSTYQKICNKLKRPFSH